MEAKIFENYEKINPQNNQRFCDGNFQTGYNNSNQHCIVKGLKLIVSTITELTVRNIGTNQ